MYLNIITNWNKSVTLQHTLYITIYVHAHVGTSTTQFATWPVSEPAASFKASHQLQNLVDLMYSTDIKCLITFQQTLLRFLCGDFRVFTEATSNNASTPQRLDKINIGAEILNSLQSQPSPKRTLLMTNSETYWLYHHSLVVWGCRTHALSQCRNIQHPLILHLLWYMQYWENQTTLQARFNVISWS